MVKRLFDIIFSFIGLIICSPVFIMLGIAICLDSHGGIFFKQQRVGKNGKLFSIYKFRSMRTGSDKKGQLTVGSNDRRITKTGRFIRKYKLDELPQLINVLIGNMSVVGPRPEVPKYVSMYSDEQRKVLQVKPGITDYASIEYANENDLLASSTDPENTYINEIMPDKLALNRKYIQEKNLITDIKILIKTVTRVLHHK
ncbi:MAG: sugar transferase [Bacteroidota bacterium]|nr:sugar transferase [Bacteroidota bacterium]